MNDALFSFFKSCPPFEVLPDTELLSLIPQLTRKSVKANTLLYRHAVSPLRELSVIYSGSIEKYFLEKGGEKLFPEHFRKGDTFGAISILLNNRRAIRFVRSREDTVLYQLPDTLFISLCERYEEFSNFFTAQFGRRMLRSGYAGFLLHKVPEPGGLDFQDQYFRLRVNEMLDPALNTCPDSATILEAAQQITYARKGYVLVMSAEGKPVGVVSDSDLREKVILAGRDTGASVREIMHPAVYTIPAGALGHEAILKMLRLKVQRLFVAEGDQLIGVVTLESIYGSPARAPFLFIEGIGQATQTAELAVKWSQTPQIVQRLLERGVRPETVNQVITAISDAITHNIISRVIRELGEPPAAFAFMALGSEGRQEQTLRTDQDNAIIYEDVEESRRESVRSYFLTLGEKVCDALNEAGFAYCEGELMAKNSQWNHSLSHWKSNYDAWLEEPFASQVLRSVTFFDCRTVYGQSALLDELRGHFLQKLRNAPDLFFAQLAKISLEIKPPLTFFNNFQLKRAGGKDNVIDLKLAMMPIADFVRIHALKHGIEQANTGERLRRLADKQIFSEEEFQELQQGYYLMMRLRLIQQAKALTEARTEADNLIEPEALTQIERAALREIFKVVQKYQSRMGLVFAGMRI